MKIFTKKGTIQKIIIAVLIVILCNFIFPTYSRAGIGGILFDPISNLITTIGDVILSALQYFMYDGSFDFTAGGISNLFGNLNQLPDTIKKYPDMKFDESRTNALEIDKKKFNANLIDLVASVLDGSTYAIPTVQYSIDKIFAGKIPAFDINFISPNDYDGDATKQEKSISYQISDIIAKWYVSLRNLSIIILLSVLVYTGIRIVISSSADDKAKYKQRIFDWLIAMCLIFFMHYIMLFTISMIDILNDTIGDAATSIPVRILDGSTTEAEFNTNLMGIVRLQVQYNDFTSQLTFTIFYIALLVYTVKFSWIYMKRLITMMFLTIIAPLVAMTYPIDKMNDGKAQAFNAWLKEYIFTALLQPFHLIIYTVLVGSAINIVKINPIYAIMVIAFIGPAEKMLRKFFGFDKASSPGMLSQAGAMFGGAAAWNMTKRAIGAISHKEANGGKGADGNKGNGNVRTVAENSNAPDGYDAFAKRPQDVALGAKVARQKYGRSAEQEVLKKEGIQKEDKSEDLNNLQNQNWDNNDMYLNPQNYSSDFENADAPVPETNTQNLDTGESEQTDRSFWQKAGAVATAPIRGAGRSIKDFASDKFAKKRWKGTALSAAKKTAKFAGRVAVAGTVGAIGIGMGIAGDDLEDVLKYGAAAGALGYSIAPGVGRKIANTGLAKAISDETGKAIYGTTNAAEIAKQTNELYESGELRDWAQETFLDENGNKRIGKELNELEDRAIGHYNDGFTDKGDIKKVMKLEDKMRKELQENLPAEEANEQARRMSETIGKLSKEVDPKKLSKASYREEQIEKYKKGIKNTNPGLSDDEALSNAKQIMDYMMKFYKQP